VVHSNKVKQRNLECASLINWKNEVAQALNAYRAHECDIDIRD
jgi:hypothetical protein